MLAALGLPVLSRADVRDGVKAVVNDQAISFAEVEEFVQPAVIALSRQYSAQPDVLEQRINQAASDGLEQLVERQLILRSFDTEGYKLPDGVVDDLVQDRIREKYYGDRRTLIKSLQTQGMTYEQFRKQIRDQYIEAALRHQNVDREIIISPYKVEQYYKSNQDKFMLEDQVKLRMIVLNKTSSDDTNVLKLAHEIQAKIKEGASFTEMATIYSQGSQQHQGGDWGWVERSVLRPELAAVAAKLAPGQTSDIIDTPDFIYLMLVEDKKTAQAKPLADVQIEIEKTLRAQQQTQLQKQWIEGLKKKTFIRYF